MDNEEKLTNKSKPLFTTNGLFKKALVIFYFSRSILIVKIESFFRKSNK